MAYEEELEEYFYNQYYDNVDGLERKWQGLELVAEYFRDRFHFTGNITWSKLEGNYNSETAGQPGGGQSYHWFDTIADEDGRNPVQMYDPNIRTPYGYLTGHRPIIMKAQADYAVNSKSGRTVFGFAYQFYSGNHYSDARYNDPAALNPKLPASFGNDWTQYKDNKRGDGVFNGVAYHDLSITHDFSLFKVADYQATAFVKLVIYNFFNHQQQISWNTTWDDAAEPYYDAPWIAPATYGTIYTSAANMNNRIGSSNYFGSARQISLSAGIRL
jgi:hypothetical protein